MPMPGLLGMPRHQFRLIALLCALATAAAVGAASTAAVAGGCSAPDGGLGVSRIVEIDPKAGPLYGHLSRYDREPSFLEPKEVVLTFDDGPAPGLTTSILDTLDRFCTKATFFVVGQMALATPEGIGNILSRGHTVGTHTWSHPMNMPRLGLDKARNQIESGFAAAAIVAKGQVAPFFRFPGLADSPALLAYLQDRGIATFTVDVVSNDSYIADPARLIQLTFDRLESQGRGILLFHDIKSVTARALPAILARLKERGYRVVHMRAARSYAPLPDYVASVRKAAESSRNAKRLLPFFAAAGVGDGTDAPAPASSSDAAAATAPAATVASLGSVPVTTLVPEPKSRIATPLPAVAAAGGNPLPKRVAAVSAVASGVPGAAPSATRHRTRLPTRIARADLHPSTTGWATTVRAASRRHPPPRPASTASWPWQ
jgi:peptidoglycan/xylan/chitin deacetylase (PgdA/CDA1 family)